MTPTHNGDDSLRDLLGPSYSDVLDKKRRYLVPHHVTILGF